MHLIHSVVVTVERIASTWNRSSGQLNSRAGVQEGIEPVVASAGSGLMSTGDGHFALSKTFSRAALLNISEQAERDVKGDWGVPLRRQ